jgi:CDP-diacylglycerol--serine O-phosphatidyltransferase
MIARSLPNRSDYHRAIGMQLDTLIDIISFSVFPAVFLASYGKFKPFFYRVPFLLCAEVLSD